MNERVAVALSGGVDSTVAAALLIEKGYDVFGITLQLWNENAEKGGNKTDSDNQARIVAEQLKIPLIILDVKEVFKNSIVNKFIMDYFDGLTPNPCFSCNQIIKWGLMLDEAIKHEAVHLATGHYARIIKDEFNHCHLYRAKDATKDQSYVLSGLTKKQLDYALLPLGDLYKSEVREYAHAKKLKAADNPESQDLCFIGKEGYRAFIDKHRPYISKPGIIRKANGDEIGKHQGLENYTIGQRKGIGSGYGVPHYVIAKDIEKNELVIGTDADLGTNLIHAKLIKMITNKPFDSSHNYEVKIRYKATPVPCIVELEDESKFRILLPNIVRDATPGQIAVIYNQDEVVGSGIILSAERA